MTARLIDWLYHRRRLLRQWARTLRKRRAHRETWI
jgi:hypothetical protein